MPPKGGQSACVSVREPDSAGHRWLRIDSRMADSRSFPVVLLPQPEGGFVVQCPALPGCYSQGETVEECLANIKEAIELALEDAASLGETVPPVGPPIFTEVTIAA